MDKLAISLLFVKARNAVIEYVGWDTILLSNISTSRMSKVLQNKSTRGNQQIKLTKEKEKGKYQQSWGSIAKDIAQLDLFANAKI